MIHRPNLVPPPLCKMKKRFLHAGWPLAWKTCIKCHGIDHKENALQGKTITKIWFPLWGHIPSLDPIQTWKVDHLPQHAPLVAFSHSIPFPRPGSQKHLWSNDNSNTVWWDFGQHEKVQTRLVNTYTNKLTPHTARFRLVRWDSVPSSTVLKFSTVDSKQIHIIRVYIYSVYTVGSQITVWNRPRALYGANSTSASKVTQGHCTASVGWNLLDVGIPVTRLSTIHR